MTRYAIYYSKDIIYTAHGIEYKAQPLAIVSNPGDAVQNFAEEHTIPLGELCAMTLFEESEKQPVNDISSRDTHFYGFSERLYTKLTTNKLVSTTSPLGLSSREAFRESQQTIIARAVYDLIAHALLTNGFGVLTCRDAVDVAAVIREYIPDLTELPDE